MAETVTYTSATAVLDRIENAAAALGTSQIEEYILNAEAMLNAAGQVSYLGSTTFELPKHRVYREGATLYAAVQCVIFNPAGFTTTREAFAIVDAMWGEFQFILGVLQNTAMKDYIKDL